jgi:hypothetical protein
MLYVHEKSLSTNPFRMQHVVMVVTMQKDNAIETGRRDRLLNNFHFHLVEVTLTCWRVFFGLCKLFVLQHHCDFNKHDFFSTVRDRNI